MFCPIIANKGFSYIKKGDEAMSETHESILPERGEDALMGKYLIFSMGKELYGIEIKNITEIIGMQPVTSMPEMPHYVKGITNLRGKIIPVMDARMRFGMLEKEYDDRTCIIVIEAGGKTTGLIVDRVVEVITLSEEEISPPLDINGSANRFIKGFGKAGGKVELLVDCQTLMGNESFAIAL